MAERELTTNYRSELQRKTLGEIGYEAAAEYLERIWEWQGCSVDIALQMEECELRLGRGKAEEAARRTRRTLVQFYKEESKRIRELGDNYDPSSKKQRVLALILYHRAHEIYEREPHESKDRLTWVHELVRDVRLAAYEIAGEGDDATSQKIALTCGAQFAQQLIKSISEINDCDNSFKFTVTAQGYFRIADIYFRLHDYETSITYLTQSLQISHNLENIDDDGLQLHCIAMWILGNCYYRLKRFAVAESRYVSTLSEVKKYPIISEKWAKIVERDLIKSRNKQVLGHNSFASSIADDAHLWPGLDIRSASDFISDAPAAEAQAQRTGVPERRNSLKPALKEAALEIRRCRGRENICIQNVKRIIDRDSYHTANSVFLESEKWDTRYASDRLPALILHRIAFEKYKDELDDLDSVAKWIMYLARDIFQAAYELAAESESARMFSDEYGAKLLEDILFFLLDMENAGLAGLLQLAEAECRYYLANIYFRLESYEECAVQVRQATHLFADNFAERPFLDEHYVLSWWILGNCHYRMSEFEQAEFCYMHMASAVAESGHVFETWSRIASRDLLKSRYKQGLGE